MAKARTGAAPINNDRLTSNFLGPTFSVDEYNL